MSFFDAIGRTFSRDDTAGLVKGILSDATNKVWKTENEKEILALEKIETAIKELTAIVGGKLDDVVKDAETHANKVIGAADRKKAKTEAPRKARLAEAAIADRYPRVVLAKIDTVANRSIQAAIVNGLRKFYSQQNVKRIVDYANRSNTGRLAHEGMAYQKVPLGAGGSFHPQGGGVGTGGGGGGGVGGGGGGDAEKLMGAMELEDKAVKKFSNMGILIASGLELISAATMSFVHALGINFSDVFKGLIKDENVFKMNMRALVFETQGFVEINRDLEKSYMDVSNAVEQTGMNRSIVMRQWEKGLKKGLVLEIKDIRAGETRKKLQDRLVERQQVMNKTALFTANQLGMSADYTSEMFLNMHNTLGLSAFQIGNISDSMRQIARDTGVTGDELEKAIKSSKTVLDQMKASGTLTDQSAKTVMETMTLAQKYGIDEKMGKLMTGLAGRPQFLKMDPKDMALLRLMALGTGKEKGEDLIYKMQTGALNKPEDLKALFTTGFSQGFKKFAPISEAFKKVGMEFDMRNIGEVIRKLQNQGAEGPNATKEEKELRRQGQMQAGNLATFLSEQLNTSVGEFEQTAKFSKEADNLYVSTSEKMKKLQEQIDKLTKAGKEQLPETKALTRQYKEMDIDRMAEGFSTLQNQLTMTPKDAEAARKGSAELLTGQFGTAQVAQTQFLDKLPEAAEGLIKNLKDTSKETGMKFSDLLGKTEFKNEKELQEALASGNADTMSPAVKAINQMRQEIITQAKVNSDPVLSILQKIREWNEWLRGFAQKGLLALTRNDLVAVILEGIVAAVAAKQLLGVNLLGLITGKLKGLSGGAAKGITAASEAAEIERAIPTAVKAVEASKIAGGLLKGAESGLVPLAETMGETAEVAKSVGMIGKFSRVLGKLAVPLMIITGVIDAVAGGLAAFSDRTKIFDKDVDELSSTMGLSAVTAGVLGGVLNGLSLGILDAIGVLSPLVKFLSYTFETIYQSIYQFFSGIWEGISSIWNSKSFQATLTALSKAWEGLKGAFASFFQSIFGKGSILKWFEATWNNIFPVIRAVGKIIGAGLILAFQGLFEVMIFLMKVITPVIKIIGGVIGVIITLVSWIVKAGVFVLDWITYLSGVQFVLKLLGKVCVWLWKNALMPVVGWIGRIGKGVWNFIGEALDLFNDLADAIFGNGDKSLWGAIWGIIKLIASLPIKILSALWDGFVGVLKFFVVALPGAILSALWDGFKFLFVTLPKKIYNGLTSAFSEIAKWIIDLLPETVKRVLGIGGMTGKDIQDAQKPSGDRAMESAKGLHDALEKKDKSVTDKHIAETIQLIAKGQKTLDEAKATMKEQKASEWNPLRIAVGKAWENDAYQKADVSAHAAQQELFTHVKNLGRLEATNKGIEAPSNKQISEFAVQAMEKASREFTDSIIEKTKGMKPAESKRVFAEADVTLKGYGQAIDAAKRIGDMPTTSKKVLEAQQETNKTLEPARKPGSLYVHDTHCERWLTNICELLKIAILNPTKARPGTVVGQEGVFAPGQGKEAMATATQAMLGTSSMLASAQKQVSDKKELKSVAMESLGAFEKSAVKDAMSQEMITKAAERKDSINTILADALETHQRPTGRTGQEGVFAPDQGREAMATAITGKALDYREEMKGGISPLLATRAAIGAAIERQRMDGGTGGTSALVPSMGAIQDYLIKNQSQKLDTMISLLTQVANNTLPQGHGGGVIGSRPMSFPATSIGVKNIGEDMAQGYWDLENGSYQPTTVTSEQRW